MMKELDAAVQSVKPQKGGAKEIPKPKKSGGGAGGGGGAPSGGKPPRVGPVVSMERDLY